MVPILKTITPSQRTMRTAVLATALIYVLNPIVNRFQRMHIHRIIGSFIAFVLLIGSLVLLGFIVAPSITDQARELSSDFPQIYEDSALEIEGIIDDLGLGSADLWSYDELQDYLNDPEVQDRFFSAALDRIEESGPGAKLTRSEVFTLHAKVQASLVAGRQGDAT